MSCLPEPLRVDDIPQLKPKIVVSTQVTSDQSVVIFLTKSVGALEASEDSDPEELIAQIAVNDATITLTSDRGTYEFAFLGAGTYASGQIPLQTGEEFFLEVVSTSMGTVTSSAKVMPHVTFDYVDGRIAEDGFDTLVDVSYGFTNRQGQNYYLFSLQRFTSDSSEIEVLNPDLFSRLIDASLMSPGQYSFRHRIEARRDFIPGDTVGVFLSNISKEYYEFMQERLDSRFNFAEFLGEPANYPTNIEGGLGFFSLHIPDVRILELE